MKKHLLWFLLLAMGSSWPAAAQTYRLSHKPGSTNTDMDIEVVRTDTGPVSHLKVSLTVPALPPSNKDFTAFTRAFLYGWIIAGKDTRLSVSVCPSTASKAECPYGFPVVKGPWKVGDRIVVETDLPKSFVDAEGAHLHLGIGDAAYYPTPNLLRPSK